MKKIASFSVFTFALAMVLYPNQKRVFAQETGSDSSEVFRNSLQPGIWALQFGISYNFTLTSFQGSVLSLKRQLSRHDAVQLGIGGSLTGQTNGGSNQYDWGDTLNYGSSQSGTNSRGSIQVNLQYIYYPHPDAGINFFFGAGPTIGYSRANYKSDITPVLPVPSDSVIIINYPASPNQTQTSWNAGVSALAGVEWFVATLISIHAQYGISLTYNKSDYTNGYTYKTFRYSKMYTSTVSGNSNSHGWQVYPTSVMFGLSVYFK